MYSFLDSGLRSLALGHYRHRSVVRFKAYVGRRDWWLWQRDGRADVLTDILVANAALNYAARPLTKDPLVLLFRTTSCGSVAIGLRQHCCYWHLQASDGQCTINVQRSSTISTARKYELISPLLRDLRWLHVPEYTKFRPVVLVSHNRHKTAPACVDSWRTSGTWRLTKASCGLIKLTVRTT